MSKTVDVERLWKGWNRSPFHGFLKMELVEWDKPKGEVRFKVPFRTEYKRSLHEPGYHGGVLASIIDVAADFALTIQADSMGLPTVDLRIDYLRVTADDELTVIARSLKKGRRLGVADVEVRDTQNRLCAVGRGTFAL